MSYVFKVGNLPEQLIGTRVQGFSDRSYSKRRYSEKQSISYFSQVSDLGQESLLHEKTFCRRVVSPP